MTLGNYIKSLREKKKYSQRKLALIANLSNTTISRIENDTVTPDIDSLTKIATSLNEPLEVLLRYTAQENITTLTSQNLPNKDEKESNNNKVSTRLNELTQSLSPESLKELEKYAELLRIKETMSKSSDETSAASTKNA